MKRKLITERDVARLAAGSRLELERDTLITPAARDLAFVRAIEIISGAAAATANLAKPAATAKPTDCCVECAAGRPCCAVKWPPLADGEWLLEVRAGAVRARRIEPRRDG